MIDALREYGLADRALVSTMEVESLRVVRAAAPDIRLGWSVPKLRRNYLANPFTKRAGADRRPVRAHGPARRARRARSAAGASTRSCRTGRS